MSEDSLRLAIDGGHPVRKEMLPYGHHHLDSEDERAVVEALRSDWLTTGPRVEEFEHAIATACGTPHAVAVSNGTAALHAAVNAIGIGPGDEVIAPPLTHVATTNSLLFEGATPVFVDVEEGTLLLDPRKVEQAITGRTKAIIAVDYAGQPCDYDELRAIADRHQLKLIADACHALGAEYRGRRAGSLADVSTFSFHPVKHITTGEGGAVSTSDPALATRMRTFRNHGIASDPRGRIARGEWHYEMTSLGYNYRITDFQCALGLSQLGHHERNLVRRREIAREYDEALREIDAFRPLVVRPEVKHAYHLYPVLVDTALLRASRDDAFRALRAEGIGVNVHYTPVHLHPYYRKRFGTGPGLAPVAEQAFERLLTLPLFPAMGVSDVADVVDALRKVAAWRGRG